MTITLHDITKENLWTCANLKLKPGQEHFVAPNAFSIAQKQFYPDLHAKAIYVGDTMVGFVMWGEDVDDNPGEMWVWRLMIDAAYQGQGYARAAMMTIIEQVRAERYPALYLSYEPENIHAAAFYARLGFEETGRIEHGEKVVRLTLNTP